MDQRYTIKGVVDLSRLTLALAGSALTTSSLVVLGILPVTPGFAAGQPPVVDASGPSARVSAYSITDAVMKSLGSAPQPNRL